MKNRKLILILSLVLALTMSLGGTLAYLTDTDADVNTMVLGNVKITQNEQERDANGELVGFNQNKPALPAVYANGTATGESWAEKGVEFNGVEYKVFDDSMKNVIDKMVTVTNDGNSDAYVRTLIAIEAPEFDTNDLIHINHNGTDCDMSAPVCVTINDVDYVVFAFTYKAAVNPKATTAPSLLQLFLDPVTTNEDVAKFGTTWEVLALSQAIQADGFSDPMTALNAGFGAVTAEKVNEWFGGWETWQEDGKIDTPSEEWPSNEPRPIPAANAAELTALLEEGIPAGATVALAEGTDYGVITLANNMKNVTINAEGAEATQIVIPDNAVIEDVTITGLSLENGNKDLIVIPASASVKLNAEGCEFNGPATKGGRGFSVNASSAEILVENCIFDGVSYPVYGNCKLTAKNTTFKNAASWVFHAYGALNYVEFSGCTFETVGGIAKDLTAYPADSTFVFENNKLIGLCGHDKVDSKIFEMNVTNATQTIAGNIKDGEAWTPDSTNGLTK